jgi:hypothetical protein
MFPSGKGGMVYLDYDYMDQIRNWSGTSKATESDNADKGLRTSFINAGVQYMFNRSWGIQTQLPFDHRFLKTTDDSGDIISIHHSALGDLRLEGIYTGFSPDLSTGITFGFKLPTGDWRFSHLDRDTELGTGSTDALIGFFHRGSITPDDRFDYFVQDRLDQPFLTQGGYRPGTENDAAIGVYLNGWSISRMKITPVAQILYSYRSRDRGRAADPTDSGYERLLLSPGIELDYKRVMVYFDVEFPVYQHANGDQLVANALFKTTVSYRF